MAQLLPIRDVGYCVEKGFGNGKGATRIESVIYSESRRARDKKLNWT
jgi:hypothetical protein